jgi:hypothetical protein
MKPLLALCLLASWPCPITAEECVIEDRHRSSAFYDRAVQDLARTPYRAVAGQTYWLIPCLNYFTNDTPHKPRQNPMPEWRPIIGEVSQVLSGGLVVRTCETTWLRDRSRLVHLLNHPRADQAVDGDTIICFARRVGRHHYFNKAGAQITVENWDYGIPTQKPAAQAAAPQAK